MQIASKSQLRMSFLRWAMVTIPAVVLLGFLSGQVSNSGYDNRWFQALILPDAMPPGWVFGVVWSTLYVLQGLAIAMILNARGAVGRGRAIALFCGQFLMNLLWSPLFFAAHQVSLALLLILALLLVCIITTFAFASVRKVAAWLMVPTLVWLSLASILNFQIDRLNPDAETLAPGARRTQIKL